MDLDDRASPFSGEPRPSPPPFHEPPYSHGCIMLLPGGGLAGAYSLSHDTNSLYKKASYLLAGFGADLLQYGPLVYEMSFLVEPEPTAGFMYTALPGGMLSLVGLCIKAVLIQDERHGTEFKESRAKRKERP